MSALLHSPEFRGGQTAADRTEMHPQARRGASRLSPYIRHGLISLPRLWKAVAVARAAACRTGRFIQRLAQGTRAFEGASRCNGSNTFT